MTLRNPIFDLDGTLLDDCGTLVDILTRMCAEPGVARARSDRRPGAHERWRAGDGDGTARRGERRPGDRLVEFRARRTPAEALYQHVAIGFERLADVGFRLAVCSNKPQAPCEQVLADTGPARHVTVAVGEQPRLRPKPAPDLMATVLAALEAAPDECLFIGDSELDHQIAREAGMPSTSCPMGMLSRAGRRSTPPASAASAT